MRLNDFSHQAGLAWFASRAGQIVSWNAIQNWGGDGFLVTTAKGIYKPAGSEYALSVRQTLGSPYHDEEPVFHADGGWTYRYAQEGDATDAKSQQLATNRGLAKCMADGVPVAVLRQISAKPNTRYRILGLALVESWKDGFFTLRSMDLPIVADEATLAHIAQPTASYEPNRTRDERKKTLREVAQRQGQGAFRSGLLLAYEGRCAITGCTLHAVLEAAHITPYLGPDTNCISNGLLLRSDLHTLWDRGLLWLDDDYQVHLSPELADTEYAQWQGRLIFLPNELALRPSLAALQAQREWCVEQEAI